MLKIGATRYSDVAKTDRIILAFMPDDVFFEPRLCNHHLQAQQHRILVFPYITMIPSLRLRGVYVSRRLIVRSYSNRPVEEVPANKPREAPPVSNVAETNARYTSSQGAWDKPLVESSEEGEKKRQLQAPNRPNIWSRSQQPREKAMVGPRFEQTIMEDQVRIPFNFFILYCSCFSR